MPTLIYGLAVILPLRDIINLVPRAISAFKMALGTRLRRHFGRREDCLGMRL